MKFNSMDEIELCNLINKVGTVMVQSEWEILIMTVSNNVSSSCLKFMNCISMRMSRTISFHSLFLFHIPFSVIHLLSNSNLTCLRHVEFNVAQIFESLKIYFSSFKKGIIISSFLTFNNIIFF